jgi:hypothetical protein
MARFRGACGQNSTVENPVITQTAAILSPHGGFVKAENKAAELSTAASGVP